MILFYKRHAIEIAHINATNSSPGRSDAQEQPATDVLQATSLYGVIPIEKADERKFFYHCDSLLVRKLSTLSTGFFELAVDVR